MCDYTSPVVEVERGRKHRQPATKETPAKRSRYADNGYIPNIACTHGLGVDVQPNHKRSKCNAASLSHDDMMHFKELLYSNNSKIDQDKFILKYLVIKNPNRVTTTAIDRQHKRSTTITYL